MLPDALPRPALATLASLAVLVALPAVVHAQHTFDDDVAFLRQRLEVVVLGEEKGARVAVVPAWQGRVVTSTIGGPEAPSYGWINRELAASGKLLPHMNAFGGEDRIWLGPEGGQFSIFFKKGDPFDLEHWQTPALIDSEPWTVAHGRRGRSSSSARGSSSTTAAPPSTSASSGRCGWSSATRPRRPSAPLFRPA